MERIEEIYRQLKYLEDDVRALKRRDWEAEIFGLTEQVKTLEIKYDFLSERFAQMIGSLRKEIDQICDVQNRTADRIQSLEELLKVQH